VSTYLVLIHGDEQYWDAETPEQRAAKEAAHRAFAEAAGDALLDGRQLSAGSAATTLRGDSPGKPLVTDGPFAETKEVVGGYYLLRVADLDAAVALASLLPELNEPHGAIELRPIVEPAN
jgi:hypothetical protein